MTTTANQAHRTINQRRATEAALNNEMVTRQRVEKLEKWMREEQDHGLGLDQAVMEQRHILLDRGFFGRLRWLLTGK